MISAYRSYEANVTAFNGNKDMAVKALDIANNGKALRKEISG